SRCQTRSAWYPITLESAYWQSRSLQVPGKTTTAKRMPRLLYHAWPERGTGEKTSNLSASVTQRSDGQLRETRHRLVVIEHSDRHHVHQAHDKECENIPSARNKVAISSMNPGLFASLPCLGGSGTPRSMF